MPVGVAAAGSVANGAGQHLFIARTAAGNRRRAVLAFDVAGQIPAGSTIVAARGLVLLAALLIAAGVRRLANRGSTLV
ncbi:MAG: hypothetical protein V3T72_01740 [Thermoanaerobaculia bacterium]